jgi:hypothetical protein
MEGLIMEFLFLVLGYALGVASGLVIARWHMARHAQESGGCPTVVEVDGVWWVYLPGQGWVDASTPAQSVAEPAVLPPGDHQSQHRPRPRPLAERPDL